MMLWYVMMANVLANIEQDMQTIKVKLHHWTSRK